MLKVLKRNNVIFIRKYENLDMEKRKNLEV